MNRLTKSAAMIRAEYTVTDGRRTIGVIIQAGKRYTAISAVAGQVGVFVSTRDAMRAISQASGARAEAS